MELAEVVGHLAVLRRFPVRALGGESPDECLVQGSGLAGDRIYDVFDEKQGALLNSADAPFLLRYHARFLDSMVRGTELSAWVRIMTPDGAETALTDRSWLEDVARRRGHPVSLRTRADAEAFLSWYKTKPWAETEYTPDGEFWIIAVGPPDRPLQRMRQTSR